jgi:glucokinase
MTLCLIADIGGTNARFAFTQDNKIVAQKDYKCADFVTIINAARAFINDHQTHGTPDIAVFAVAGPVNGDQIDLTNISWKFSCAEVQRVLNLKIFEVINDFKAVALGVTHIDQKYIKTIYDVPRIDQRPIGILGVGTGLGVASLVHDGVRYIAVEGEGGHVTMPARAQREFDIFQKLLNKYSHISAERVCSGKGIENLYHAICALDNITPIENAKAEIISQKAIDKLCPVCAEVMDLMCAFLGRVTGNLALILKAEGGMYIAGGIPPKLGEYFFRSRFVDEYTSKGRMSDVVKSIPVFMIDHPSVGMVGLQHRAHELAQKL